MSIPERKYQSVKWEQLVDCLRFCQNRLNLRDWTIELIEGKENPEADEYACLSMSDDMKWRELAKMYIDLEACKRDDINPYVCICHESIHILTCGKCGLTMEKEMEERIPRTFEDLLYAEWCRHKKMKPAGFREDKE